MAKGDRLDESLIRLLQQDARRSSAVLARDLNVIPATVRRRVRNLIKKGVIRIAAIPDPEKLGLSLAAIIAFNVDHDRLEAVVDALTTCQEVDWACTTTGRFDIMIMARFHSAEELARFIQADLTKIKGIRDSETFICLESRIK